MRDETARADLPGVASVDLGRCTTPKQWEGLIGDTPEIRAVIEKIEMVAPTDATVLIRGETGTGKELVARAIHRRSRRAANAFVAVNCAALAVSLVDSELFGHEKGAFTGAIATKVGRFESADGGTILLDEVGELSEEVQAKLLRVLQEREFERVGGCQSRKVDVRVVAATNRNLKRAIKMGGFRTDLYYRLTAFPLNVPPLRNRKADIPLLANHFLARYSEKFSRSISCFSDDSMGALMRHDWPGNVRELEHVVERAVVLTTGPTAKIDPAVLDPEEEEHSEGQRLVDIERRHILETLDRTKWLIDGPNGAARVLGLHRNTLRYRMKKLGLERSRGPVDVRT